MGGGTLTTEQILLQSGYSPAIARQQTSILKGIHPHVDPFVVRLEAHRETIMDLMVKKVKEADYATLSRSMHTVTHNMRLLSGKTTANVGIIAEDRRSAINRLIDE